MGEQFTALLDVTIVYPQGIPRFTDLITGRLQHVVVRVQQRPIPADLLNGDPIMDRAYRRRLGDWVDQQWRDKDRLFGELQG
jgi:hypothetical protein